MKGQYIRVSQDLIDRIAELYKEGNGTKKIADELGLVRSTVSRWIREYVKTEKKVEKFKPNIPYSVNPKVESEESVQMNNEPVKATLTLCKTCIYGRKYATTDSDKCNFAGCTGRTKTAMQPNKVHTPTEKNNYTECYFYQRATRENPRRKIKFARGI